MRQQIMLRLVTVCMIHFKKISELTFYDYILFVLTLCNISEQCDAGKYMSSKGCKSCPGVSYSAKGAFGPEQCDQTNSKLITCRPIRIRPGFGTLDCSTESPISCTYSCPENTYFTKNEQLYTKFNFTCDESTKKWSHQNEINRFGRVPNCAKIRSSSAKLQVAIKFDAMACPTENQLLTSVGDYFTSTKVDSYSCFQATDTSKCSVIQVSFVDVQVDFLFCH